MKYLRIVMLLAGVALMAWGATVLVRNQLRGAEVHGWPRAEGRITLSRVDTLHRQEVGNEGDFYPHVRYDYVVNGRTFHGETLYLDEHRSFGSANVAARELVFLEVGAPAEVMYNPQNPREAALIVDKPTWRYFFIFLFGALLSWLSWRLRKVQPRPAMQPPMPGLPPGMPGLPPGMQGQPQLQVQPGMQAPPQRQAQLPGGQGVQPAPTTTSS
jgi:hypothetical protein